MDVAIHCKLGSWRVLFDASGVINGTRNDLLEERPTIAELGMCRWRIKLISQLCNSASSLFSSLVGSPLVILNRRGSAIAIS
jgi:hypothetical protein